MPVKYSLWTVGEVPAQLKESRLPLEVTLHQMIKAAPQLLSPDWMLVGSEEAAHNGRLDLLALAPDASLVLIELKRGRTPRDVVAQALDYASWVSTVTADQISEMYARFAPGRNLAQDFQDHFGALLDEDELNNSHEIVIVAAELDPSSERIVQYLSDRGIGINVLFFRVFDHGGEQLLSRAWLVDPVDKPVVGPKPSKRPWNNEYYVSFGTEESRSWQEARTFGFISAGGGLWYSRTLNQLSIGDRLWVNIPGTGYVGVGRVSGEAKPARECTITVDGDKRPALDVLDGGYYHREDAEDLEKCEYFVPVDWLQTVSEEEAVRQVGFFGNQNTVAAPTAESWRHTIDRLKQVFTHYDDATATDRSDMATPD